MSDFKDIGISRELDWPRIRKPMLIGIFGARIPCADVRAGLSKA